MSIENIYSDNYQDSVLLICENKVIPTKYFIVLFRFAVFK